MAYLPTTIAAASVMARVEDARAFCVSVADLVRMAADLVAATARERRTTSLAVAETTVHEMASARHVTAVAKAAAALAICSADDTINIRGGGAGEKRRAAEE